MTETEYVDALIRHARLFGTELVEETYGNGPGLDRLRMELALIDGRARKRRPQTLTETCVLKLRERGLVPMAIADELALSDATVRRYLSKSQTSKNGVANPHRQRAVLDASPKYGVAVA
jgi:DNA-binding NarL/FixJ family response regulator